jgi:hypothetical protein
MLAAMPKFAANPSFLFTEAPFPERFARAAAAIRERRCPPSANSCDSLPLAISAAPDKPTPD